MRWKLTWSFGAICEDVVAVAGNDLSQAAYDHPLYLYHLPSKAQPDTLQSADLGMSTLLSKSWSIIRAMTISL
jgi:hypothetical protein